MSSTISNATKELDSILDFLRFGISKANEAGLYFGHGTDNAWDDILALILSTLSLPYDGHEMLLSARLTQEEKAQLTKRLERRILDRVPVPYLTHEAHFCGLMFYVDERVLIPRSPIAELIKQAFSPWIDANRVNRILDLCTGSACIAIACCYAFPEAKVDAIDISQDALAVAEINREQHVLEEQLTLIQSDCFNNLPKTRYDIIVSNPPYVGTEEMQTLPDEYLHEPKLALETEKNGLLIVEKILNEAHDYLNDEGILVVEVGNSEEALIEAYPDVPFTWLEFESGGQGVFLLTREQLIDYF
ncbi:50S ribosomal protein L3 N(5)-glutamine methyltransferase [Legionella impletisoli]|uniref:Ribosomal protein uL3 glutamine methyltransferase n=1 Tax=Legionella impletisoli TaxID=343510 RepID=A0A917NBI2_9GAMM|nr:50S ribosomal protein L3 N(5)-glutamine methyltransferase [Legionella impletisoli]GGI85744.1 50S ribosomal protein L3 glutamine methyltransferase [Legionella impletisoli]